MFSVSQFWFSNMSSFTLLVTFSALLAAAFANHYGHAHEHHAHTNSEELARAEYEIKDIGSSSEHSGHASRYWPISHEEHKRASLHHLLNTHHRAAAAHRAGTLTAGHALELLEAHQRVAAAHGLEHLIHPHGNAHHTLHSAEAVGSRSAGKHYHAIHEHESSKMHHY
ncbi:histidine-rich glycoprotein isoform X4 [Dendroctonus ponderosae]|uniref:histidine-rich glycoprotein isoform X4 n=1 Tax=Dendroctonus ponderosae TaxID=77166 RepID=UPI00203542D1|nr:histidine-rich glycoprotein isoform X4 [Dendroctonus ponderosae]